MRVEQSIPLPVGPRAHSPPQFRSVRTVRVPPDGSPRLGVSPRRGPLSPFGSADAAELFARSHPAQAIDFPPLLDEFSRTIATPYGEDLHHGSSSGRIACHLSPLSGMLVGLSVFSFFRAPGAEVWSQEGKCLKWRQKKMPKDSKGLVNTRRRFRRGQKPEYAPLDILEREFRDLQVLPGKPRELFLRPDEVHP